MQSVLAVDISTSPAELVIAQVIGASVEIKERIELDLEFLRDHSALLKEEVAPLAARAAQSTTQPSESSPDEIPSSTEDTDLGENPLAYLEERVRDTVKSIRSAVKRLSQSWVNCVVTIAPIKNISLNLELPFGDPKNLQRIVDLEVQDVVPFDIDDFLVQYSSLGPCNNTTEGGSFDVHVGLVPKTYIRNILQLFKAAEIEPLVITVPSSAVGATFHLARDYFTTDSAVILVRDQEYSIAAWINGQVRSEHIIRVPDLILSSGSTTSDEVATKQSTAIFTAIKLTLASIERRYNTRIDSVHVIGKVAKHTLLQQILGRPVQPLAISELVKGATPELGIAALPAVFADEEPVAVPLSNFRTREFSFNPTFGELLKVVQGSWKHLLVALLLAIAAVGLTYAVRQFQINSMQQFLFEQVRKVVPDFNPGDEDALRVLAQAESKLSEELGVLGSPSKISPLDVLIEIHKRLPQLPGITITSLKISGSRATISGFAPDLSAIERVEKELKANQGEFAKVTANPGTSAGSRYNFTVEIILSK